MAETKREVKHTPEPWRGGGVMHPAIEQYRRRPVINPACEMFAALMSNRTHNGWRIEREHSDRYKAVYTNEAGSRRVLIHRSRHGAAAAAVRMAMPAERFGMDTVRWLPSDDDPPRRCRDTGAIYGGRMVAACPYCGEVSAMADDDGDQIECDHLRTYDGDYAFFCWSRKDDER